MAFEPELESGGQDIAAPVPASIFVPPAVRAQAIIDVGAFFEPLSKIDRQTLADVHLDVGKASNRGRLLERYAVLRNRKVLEIGAGFGTNLAVWIKEFGADGYGIEPASLGFEMSFKGAQKLFEANGLDPARIIDAPGERLPFEDGMFDIVYSANVLEHTSDPVQVLREAARVLRPGGIIHMELPNYLSYFEGHYMIPMPPMWSNALLGIWVRLFSRDPSFASTLKLINPIWCRRAIRSVSTTYPVRLITLGEDIFLEKLRAPFYFETRTVADKIGWAIRVVQAVNVQNWIGRLIVAVNGYYPIYMTIQKL